MVAPGHGRLRLAFAGTPEFAVPTLRALCAEHQVVSVYCQPARPTGRGRRIVASAVETVSRELELAVSSPASMRGEAARLAALHLDALIVVAYGKLLPTSVLEAPRYGCVNVHASLLPRWRGAAPIERAIMAGDTITGISIMQMDAGLDTGPLLQQSSCPILPEDTGDTLRERLAELGAKSLLSCLADIANMQRRPQPADGTTYATKLTAADSHVDWTRPAVQIAAQVRALNSRQPVVCRAGTDRIRLLFAVPLDLVTDTTPGTILSITKQGLVVACGCGAIRVSRLGLTRGKGRPMDVAALLNGYPGLLSAGQTLDAAN
jgi:methionyl-tRNA formyltransferase